MAGQCFRCVYVPMCAAFWFASVLNALLNTCGCVCLLFTCRMQRAFGRLLQRTVPNPARDSSGQDVALLDKHGSGQFEAALETARQHLNGLQPRHVDGEFPTPGVVRGMNVTWKRPEEFVPQGSAVKAWNTVEAGDVNQGQLGDCYLLASLSAIAEEGGGIESLIVGAGNDGEASPSNAYGVMVYQHGEWVPVYVDDRMPILRSGRPAFATSKKGDAELWPMLIEKAWVKSWAQGDYAAVEGGRPAHALRAFTGAPCEEIHHNYCSLDELWGSLTSTLDAGGMVVAATGASPVICGSMGLPAFCCYPCRRLKRAVVPERCSAGCVEERLVCLRNPWGQGEWHGAWSDNSWRWTKATRTLAGRTRGNDGVFWMSIADYSRFFHISTMCHKRNGWFSTSWDATTQGRQGVLRLTVPRSPPAPTAARTSGGAAEAKSSSADATPGANGATDEDGGTPGGGVRAFVALEHVDVGVDAHGQLAKQSVRMSVLDSTTGKCVGSTRQIQTYGSYTNAANTCTTELVLQPGHSYDVVLNWSHKDKFMDAKRPLVVGVYASQPNLELAAGVVQDTPVFVPLYEQFGECDQCHRPVAPEHNFKYLKKTHPEACTAALDSAV